MTTVEIPISKSGSKSQKNSSMSKGPAIITSDEARKMMPSMDHQQATIIKTSDNMVTIRSPALQQAMNIHAYQSTHSYKPGMNGYNNVGIYNEDMDGINDRMTGLKLDTEDRLTRQMRNLNIKEGSRASEIFVQAMAAVSRNENETSKKKKKKKKQGGSRSDEREVDPVGELSLNGLFSQIVLLDLI